MVDNCVPQRQLGSCSVTRPFLSLRKVWLARLNRWLVLAVGDYFQCSYCFTSRISSKSDSVGRVIFVNVNYEYHYSSNFYTYKPETTNNKCKNQHFSPLVGTALSHFTSALTHNRSTISGATHRWTLPTQKKSQLYEASMDLVNSYVRMRSLLTTPTNLNLCHFGKI